MELRSLSPVFGGPTGVGRDVGDVQIFITNRSGAGKILASPTRCAEFAYVVSIGDQGSVPRQDGGRRRAACGWSSGTDYSSQMAVRRSGMLNA
jgi:hypothetical protein